MIERLFPGDRRCFKPVRRGVVVLFLLVIILSPTLPALDYSYEQNEQETMLKIFHNEPLISQILTEPTSKNKIFIKLSDVGYIPTKELLMLWRIPPYSAVRNLRLIPYNNHLLLVVDLWNPVDYKIETNEHSIQIILDDAAYRDPITYEYLQGLFYHQTNQYQKALQHYRQVIAKKRDHALAFYKAGQIRLAWKEYRKAEINFLKALRFGCDSTGIYKELSKLYRIRGDHQKANYYQSKIPETLSPASEKKTKNADDEGMHIELTSTHPVKPHTTTVHSDGRSGEKKLTTTKGKQFPVKMAIFFGLVLFSQAVYITVKLQKEKKSSSEVSFVIPSSSEGNMQSEEQDTLPSSQSTHSANEQPSQEPTPEEELPPEHLIRVNEKVQRLIEMAEAYHEGDHSETNSLIDELLNPRDRNATDLMELIEETTSVEGTPQEAISRELSASDIGFLEKEKAQELARKLRTGLGEIELALNLSNTKDTSLRNKDIRWKILKLNEQNLPVEEIARQANVGKEEVELLLRLSQNESSLTS
ncbi:MAG: hypothetical protein D6748_01245 [Calditrichaeota bacterium]|nr:MAG: hypothetical protein D6748_01245 [Calditrichota bacterium]